MSRKDPDAFIPQPVKIAAQLNSGNFIPKPCKIPKRTQDKASLHSKRKAMEIRESEDKHTPMDIAPLPDPVNRPHSKKFRKNSKKHEEAIEVEDFEELTKNMTDQEKLSFYTKKTQTLITQVTAAMKKAEFDTLMNDRNFTENYMMRIAKRGAVQWGFVPPPEHVKVMALLAAALYLAKTTFRDNNFLEKVQATFPSYACSIRSVFTVVE